MGEGAPPRIVIKCQGYQSIEIDKEAASKSVFLKGLIDDYKEFNEITIPNLSIHTVTQICEYLNYITKNPEPRLPKPLQSSSIDECFQQQFYRSLMHQYPLQKVFELKQLLFAANDVKGVRDLLGIESDYSPEEEAEMLKEHSWIY